MADQKNTATRRTPTAAAYTVPGGLNQKIGSPVLLTEPIYMVFTVMDIVALAELKDGATPATLKAHARGALNKYMQPRDWRFPETLPQTPSGKIDYQAIQRAERQLNDISELQTRIVQHLDRPPGTLRGQQQIADARRADIHVIRPAKDLRLVGR